MKYSRIPGVVAVLLLFPVVLAAQGTPMGDVAVRSTPSGAHAMLQGDVTVSGVTPARFRQLLIGDYQLTVRMYGYETYRTRVVLDPTKQIEVDVKLSPQTRFKAGLRSLVVPGWGQFYCGQTTRGAVYSGLTLGAGLALLFAETDYLDKRDAYRDLADDFDAAGSLAEQRDILPRLASAREKAYDAETVQRVTFGVLAGVWAFNVLDAVFMFPGHRGTVSVKGLALAPSIDSEKAGVTISKGF
jgi:hypothetical protein